MRLLTEVLLRDGWGIDADVTLVEMPAAQLVEALGNGLVDCTSWNLVLPSG